MKKLALTAGAVLALSVMTASPSWAQVDTVACDEAKANVTSLEKKLDTAVFDERKDEEAKRDTKRAARDAAQVEVDKAQKALDDAGGNGTPELRDALARAKEALKDAKEELRDAQEKLDNDSTKVAGLRAQVELAIQERDRLCGGVTTTPPVPDNDVDCDEVSDARAQEILDADRSDPNNLDTDNDGVACEEDVLLNPPPTVNVVVPSGGVSTGGGPA